MKINRTKNAARNMVMGFINKIIVLLLPFLVRTAFIYSLGAEYLGLNSLFSSILSVLSVAELGFSSAVVFSMYEPIAKNQQAKICALLNYYRSIYRVIGTAVLIGGVVLMPFLPRLINKKKNTRLGERIQKIFSTRRVFHSAGMCLLEAEGFYPCGQVGFAGIGIEHLAMQQFCTGAARSKLFIGLAHVAAARCGKGDDCFTFQIIAFQKCIDNRRSNIPPNRESDKDGVVFVHVIALDGDGRARGGIAHFDGAAGFLVHPVQIGLGVRNFRLNLKNVCTDSIGKIFSNLCGNAAGGEVSNKSFAHDKCTSFDRFSWFKYSTLNREHQVRLSGRMC